MAPETIVVDNLSKTYQVPEREGGNGLAFRSQSDVRVASRPRYAKLFRSSRPWWRRH